MMAAAVESGNTFAAGLPAALFSVNTIATQAANGRQYAVTRDGRRFLVNAIQEQTAAIPLTVVVNWPSALQK